MSNEFGIISVIMAAYNAENTISRAILSVLNQTYSDLELIVINDCSRDGTKQRIQKIAEEDSRVHLINNDKNLGVANSRRIGMDAAKGEWIAILDSDDIWLPDKLEKQTALQMRKDADLIFTGSGFLNSKGDLIPWQLHVPGELGFDQLLKQNLISNSSVLVRKSLYRECYALKHNIHEDYAIWLRATRNGHTAYGIDEPLLLYRIGKSSKTGNKIKSAVMNWRTYRYIGLGFFSSVYYMFWYTMNGINKYMSIKKACDNRAALINDSKWRPLTDYLNAGVK